MPVLGQSQNFKSFKKLIQVAGVSTWVAAAPALATFSQNDNQNFCVTASTSGKNEIQLSSRIVPFEPKDLEAAVDTAIAQAVNLESLGISTKQEFVRMLIDRLGLHTVTFSENVQKAADPGYNQTSGTRLETSGGIDTGGQGSRIMADMPILKELDKSLRDVEGVREVFYSQDGEYHVFVVFLDPAHYESGEKAYERWLDFDNSNCERLKTDVDISTYTAERLETFKQKGFKEFQT